MFPTANPILVLCTDSRQHATFRDSMIDRSDTRTCVTYGPTAHTNVRTKLCDPWPACLIALGRLKRSHFRCGPEQSGIALTRIHTGLIALGCLKSLSFSQRARAMLELSCPYTAGGLRVRPGI